MFTANITNFSAHVARRIDYTVGVRYSDDAEKTIRIIKDVLEAHPFVLSSSEPQAAVDELGDNSVNIMIRFWAPTTERWNVKLALLWKIKQALESGGMEIPFPQRVVWPGRPSPPPEGNETKG